MIALIGNLLSRGGKLCCALLLCIFVSDWFLARGQIVSETQLRSRAQLLNSEVPVSFPERLVVTSSGKAFLLDTDLSTLFTLNKDGSLKRMCGSDALASPSDISVDASGNIWVLSGANSKIVKLAPNCQPQAQIVSRQMPLRIATNVSIHPTRHRSVGSARAYRGGTSSDQSRAGFATGSAFIIRHSHLA